MPETTKTRWLEPKFALELWSEAFGGVKTAIAALIEALDNGSIDAKAWKRTDLDRVAGEEVTAKMQYVVDIPWRENSRLLNPTDEFWKSGDTKFFGVEREPDWKGREVTLVSVYFRQSQLIAGVRDRPGAAAYIAELEGMSEEPDASAESVDHLANKRKTSVGRKAGTNGYPIAKLALRLFQKGSIPDSYTNESVGAELRALYLEQGLKEPNAENAARDAGGILKAVMEAINQQLG